jgi:Domain of unknown function (DUF4432)
MAADRTAARGPWNAVELSSAELGVTLLPAKGCDVLELVDRGSGVDVLLKTPWTPGRIPVHAPSSFEAWIEAYPGGWQLLLPNGGDATVEHGVEWGFHGEAALVAWRVEELEQTRAVCSAELVTAPLGVSRVVSLDGPVLRIEEAVTNGADQAIEVMWGHHPALGAPFLEPGCTISAPARVFHTDDRAPGTGLAAGVVSEWPHAALEAGGTVDLSVIPPADERRAVLGYLTDFEEGRYRVSNPRLGLELELRWPLELFPAAWFWQELRASAGYPWYRRLYTTALEPNSSWPGPGLGNVRAKGGSPLLLGAGETRTAIVEAELRRVRRVAT